jgi:hypothetical protein
MVNIYKNWGLIENIAGVNNLGLSVAADIWGSRYEVPQRQRLRVLTTISSNNNGFDR